MKEAGRSIRATRSVGSVSIISKGAHAESRAGSFSHSLALSPRPVNHGIRMNSYIAPGISEGRGRIPQAFRPHSISIAPERSSAVQTKIFRPLGGLDNRSETNSTQRTHSRRPRRSYHDRRNLPNGLIEVTAKPLNKVIDFQDLSKPRVFEHLTNINRQTDGEKALSIITQKAEKRELFSSQTENAIKATNINWPKRTTYNLELLTNKILRKKPGSIQVETPKNLSRIDNPVHSEPTHPTFQVPDLERFNVFTPIRKNKQIKEPKPEIQFPVTLPKVDVINTHDIQQNKIHMQNEADMQKSVLVSSRIRHLRLISEEEKEQEQELVRNTVIPLISSQTEINKAKDKLTSKKNTVVAFALKMIKDTKKNISNAEPWKKKRKKIKYVVDNLTNKSRLEAIAKIRKIVVRSNKIHDQEPTWREVVNLLPKKPDKPLISELVRGFKDEDGSWTDVTNILKDSGVIFPNSKIDPIVRSITAVKASEHGIDEVTERDVNRVLGQDKFKIAA